MFIMGTKPDTMAKCVCGNLKPANASRQKRTDDRYITKTVEDLFSFGPMKVSDLHPQCQLGRGHFSKKSTTELILVETEGSDTADLAALQLADLCLRILGQSRCKKLL